MNPKRLDRIEAALPKSKAEAVVTGDEHGTHISAQGPDGLLEVLLGDVQPDWLR